MALGEKTTYTDVDGVRVLAAPSALDVYTVPAFRDTQVEAVNAGRYRQVVDLSKTTYIDSTGLGVLVGALKRTRAHMGWLRLAALPEQVSALLRTTGLTQVFEVFDSVDAAVIGNPAALITAVAEVFETCCDDEDHGGCSISRIYTDLATAKARTEFDYVNHRPDRSEPVGALTWVCTDDCIWDLLEAGRPTRVCIEGRFVFGPPGVAWVPSVPDLGADANTVRTETQEV